LEETQCGVTKKKSQKVWTNGERATKERTRLNVVVVVAMSRNDWPFVPSFQIDVLLLLLLLDS
jgi:hypothetical protein